MRVTVPDVDLATLQAWLLQARTAYNDLVTGASVVEVVADGYVTKYRAADAKTLRAYIGDLEARVAAAMSGRPARPGAIGFTF